MKIAYIILATIAAFCIVRLAFTVPIINRIPHTERTLTDGDIVYLKSDVNKNHPLIISISNHMRNPEDPYMLTYMKDDGEIISAYLFRYEFE